LAGNKKEILRFCDLVIEGFAVRLCEYWRRVAKA
jgi:hypothetical protein